MDSIDHALINNNIERKGVSRSGNIRGYLRKLRTFRSGNRPKSSSITPPESTKNFHWQALEDRRDVIRSRNDQREIVLCYACEHEWYYDEHGRKCPSCGSEIVEIIDLPMDPSPLGDDDGNNSHYSHNEDPETETQSPIIPTNNIDEWLSDTSHEDNYDDRTIYGEDEVSKNNSLFEDESVTIPSSKPVASSLRFRKPTRLPELAALESLLPVASTSAPPSSARSFLSFLISLLFSIFPSLLAFLAAVYTRLSSRLRSISSCSWFMASYLIVLLIATILSLWWTLWKSNISGGFTLGAFVAFVGCSAVDKLHGWHRDGKGCSRCRVETVPEPGGGGKRSADHGRW